MLLSDQKAWSLPGQEQYWHAHVGEEPARRILLHCRPWVCAHMHPLTQGDRSEKEEEGEGKPGKMAG